MPSASKPDIIITSKLIELLSEEELQFIIGHEVAHYYYQHSLYPHYENVTERHQKLNILNLSRSAEISADRVGLIASGSLEKSLRANLKLASWLGEKHLKFSFEKIGVLIEYLARRCVVYCNTDKNTVFPYKTYCLCEILNMLKF